MIHAIKVAHRFKYSHQPFLTPSLSSFPSSICRKTSSGSRTTTVRFQQAKTESINQPENQKDSNMEQQQQQQKKKADNPHEKTGDGRVVTSHSYGEGYSTRCDEEGFGGIYARNQSLKQEDPNDDEVIHENHPDYDKTQGSEVREKEKGRHSK